MTDHGLKAGKTPRGGGSSETLEEEKREPEGRSQEKNKNQAKINLSCRVSFKAVQGKNSASSRSVLKERASHTE